MIPGPYRWHERRDRERATTDCGGHLQRGLLQCVERDRERGERDRERGEREGKRGER